MKTRRTSSNRPSRMQPEFVDADPKSSSRNEVTQFLADIDGVSVLVRFLVEEASVETQSDSASRAVDRRSLLSSTAEKMVARMGGSRLRRDAPSEKAYATVELVSSAEDLARLPALSNDTVLRVGPLELDLLDRTAKRGDRRIDLRPREFQLLKYMMQQSDKLVTRATLLKDVWNYKIAPETNLVDVHMGKLRRKVDGPSDLPLIRNVRGSGFVLSATGFPKCSAPSLLGTTDVWPPNGASRLVERTLQC